MFTAWVKNSLLGSRKIEFITWVNPSSEYSLLGSEQYDSQLMQVLTQLEHWFYIDHFIKSIYIKVSVY